MPSRTLAPAWSRGAHRVLLGAVLVVGGLVPRLGGRAVDLEVYRTAGRVVGRGLPLYAAGYPWGSGVGLPFTYPPVAALVLGRSALLPSALATAVVTLGGVAALLLTLRLATASIGFTSTGAPRTRLLGILVVAAALALEPVRSTLFFGQVNLLLMVLVVADVLPVRTRHPRGLLLGLAAAVKLVPLVFLVLLLVRRDRRAAATALGVFAVAQGVGAVVLPRDSGDYWLGGVVTSASRVGPPATAANQSLTGVLARMAPQAPGWVTAAVAAAVLGLVVAAVAERTRRGDDLGALLCTAAGGLLLSPVSWTHHWVWVVPALPWAVARARGLPARLALTVPFALFLVGPSSLLPSGGGRELGWTWWQHVVGDAYVEVALVVLVVAALPSLRRAAAWVARRRSRPAASTTAVAVHHAPVTSPGTPSPR
ncbi:glycosyltransferase 87 family protein [Lapillicoccus jejuensis]|uniref:glycosyltransferase 87 family protein n=1 Tax=Lapillicoccus jejuensis TaxID=402171 RepID=UPI0011538A45